MKTSYNLQKKQFHCILSFVIEIAYTRALV